MQSMFVLFHIDQQSRSQFACDINKHLIKINSDIEDLVSKYPEVVELDQTNEVEEVLKIAKEGECSDEMCHHNMKFGEAGSEAREGIQKVLCQPSLGSQHPLIPSSLIGNNTLFRLIFEF